MFEQKAGLTLTNEAAQSSVLNPKYPAQVLFTFFLPLLSMLLSGAFSSSGKMPCSRGKGREEKCFAQ